MDKNPSMVKATVIGGLSAAVLSAIPIVGCLNLACCSLLIGGGLLASFIYSRDVAAAGGTFAVGNGAAVGLVTGGFYAVGSAFASAITRMIIDVSPAEQFELIREQMESSGSMPPEMLDSLDQVSSFLAESGGGLLFIIGFGFSLLLGAVFCTVGGLIGGAVFKQQPPAPAAPPTPEGGSAD
ncbi:MAG: hypothetical protein GTN89_08205 [Acidobacteria bacterium]|nr:hypothetical protein [Acidobacteriota bacterium]NIM63756.1 hypothetical protein [Acidobacteriota bacterium]NIO59325.1 hypothetical protein [Acidobacteriota bacterium]NIQ30339.1 hypothetical protein [Acidobacteriota bacterium]NIQ85276.1 hypothetical protein [Acidobacteriota bacterium]